MPRVSLALPFALLGACGAFDGALPRAGRSAASRVARAPARMATIERPAMVELPNLDGALPDCPRTEWNSDGMDIAAEQQKLKAMGLPACPLEIVATPQENAQGAAYFTENAERLRALLREHGTLWLKGFDLTKDEAGFHRFYDSIGLSPCLDPIHTSGLRAFASARDAVYQEVNKQSLAGHYIGLHNEATTKKTARFGAFVCFKPASVRGGEFFIADGAAIFRDMRTDVLKRLYERKVRRSARARRAAARTSGRAAERVRRAPTARAVTHARACPVAAAWAQVRISVSNLDLDVLGALGPLKEGAMDAVKGLVQQVVAPKFDMDLGARAPARPAGTLRVALPLRPATAVPLRTLGVAHWAPHTGRRTLGAAH